MPEGPRQRALDLSKRFLFDAPGWFQEGDRSPHLAAVARAVWDRHRISVLYRSWTTEAVRILKPYGLVLKNGVWYVAAATAGGTTVRTYRVNQILELTTLDESFDVPDSFGLDNNTLLEALSFQGGPTLTGAAQILLRAAVAAELNAASANVNYPLSVAQVTAEVNAALASGDRTTILNEGSRLDGMNNLGCPLS